MSFGLTYRAKWQTAKLQNMELNIWDRLNTQGGPRPYNIQWTEGLPGSGWNVEFTFDELPPDSTGLVIVASIPGTAITFSYLGAPTSPRTISLPYSSGVGWKYKFLIQNPGQGEQIDLSILYPMIVPVSMTRGGCTLASVDSDDDLYKAIKAKQLNLRLLTQEGFGLHTFRQQNAYDDRYYVTLQKNDNFIFKGYLILDEINEPFLPGKKPFTLKATDRLGTLKTKALTKPDDTNPRGEFRIIDYISWCLKKTGLNLNINVCMNIREEGSSPSVFDTQFATVLFIVPLTPIFKVGRTIRITDAGPNSGTCTITNITGPIVAGPNAGKYNIFCDRLFDFNAYSAVRFDDAQPNMYHRVYLDSRTFEKEINASEDCYKVLEKCLNPGMFVTQEKGEWWIKRHGETANNPLYITVFDADGLYLADNEPTAYSKGVARGSSIQNIDKAGGVYLNRPASHILLTYDYNFPKELVCNIDYKRGDVIVDEEPDFSLPDTLGKYEIECWTLRKFNGDPVSELFAYIHRKFAYAVETERWVAFSQASVHTASYLESEKMIVRAKDRINFSADYKYTEEVQTGGFYRNSVAQIRLYGSNGDNYMLHGGTSVDPKPRWQATDADFSINNVYIVFEGNSGQDSDKEWRTGSLWQTDASPDIPVDGRISIVLCNEISTNEGEKHFSNIKLEYIPWINGTYKKLSAINLKVAQPVSPDGTFAYTEEFPAFIGNAWSQNFKGCLLVKNGDSFEPAGLFYDASLNQDTVWNPDDRRTYLELIAFDLYNQFRYPTLTFRLHLFGLENLLDVFDRDDSPGLLHRYRMLDPSPNTGGSKWNHLISFNQNHDTEQWIGTFREVFDWLIARTTDRNLLTIDYKEA